MSVSEPWGDTYIVETISAGISATKARQNNGNVDKKGSLYLYFISLSWNLE